LGQIEGQTCDTRVLVHHSSLWEVIAYQVSEAESAVDVFAPYVLPNALEQVTSTRRRNVSVSVITTWKLKDILLGASSLTLYDFCQANGIYLFLSQRLHLKTILKDYRCILTGSANITNRGLGLVDGSNHETLVMVQDPGMNYLIFLQTIRDRATLVTDTVVERFRTALEGLSLESPDELGAMQEALDKELIGRDAFLISELPMSRSIDDLYEVFSRQDMTGHFDDEVVANAMSDIARYSLLGSKAKTRERFVQHIRTEFFLHPFIHALCGFIDRPRRFGEVKEWVQRNCTSVPVPSRRDLTGNVQVLYEWIGHLGKDQYKITRPNVTQIISPR
jgi:phosphatidylserine/phosphatidylglycerophosphate/cardiolipin synthase-like enzyme